MFQNFYAWLALQNFDEKSKVLFYLLSKLEYNSYLRVTRKEISDWIGVLPTNVSRALKNLKDMGIIAEGPAAGKFKTYRLVPLSHTDAKIAKKNIIDFKQYRKLLNNG